ncbi:hypothetical protein TVAG_069830 [Trichomonas vaginalis G3]|uniref:Uncharacterized protein n=1 Tax=Trichomonas vaginalis (strain ATCC PRA-98 / G3) TaxID=412133 RepID=A2ESM4_TRIV3|nr:hypothetical protein TVAGG3_0220670 [Trichomonas vaginalis G3]EAY04333.1 hypothetical protein TVAG_069830 [Trichomonas vaginalis G3]KAI5551907.1 hypothetical protein TVAGG3_0220670 [Trichomonas vaginalis G3]|eukprot:XP_001316556.1 hypothetical protein [Trichomonas vaginalis G3]
MEQSLDKELILNATNLNAKETTENVMILGLDEDANLDSAQIFFEEEFTICNIHNFIQELLQNTNNYTIYLTDFQTEQLFDWLAENDLDQENNLIILKLLELYTMHFCTNKSFDFPDDALSILLPYKFTISALNIFSEMINRKHDTVNTLDRLLSKGIFSTINSILEFPNDLCDSALHLLATIYSTAFDAINIDLPFNSIMTNKIYLDFPSNSFLVLKAYIGKSQGNALKFTEFNATDIFSNIVQFPESVFIAVQFFNELVCQIDDLNNLLDDYNVAIFFNWIIENSSKTNNLFSKSVPYIENILYNHFVCHSYEAVSYIVDWLISNNLYQIIFDILSSCSSECHNSYIKMLCYMLIYSTPGQINYLINQNPLLIILGEEVSATCNREIINMISQAFGTIAKYLRIQIQGPQKIENIKKKIDKDFTNLLANYDIQLNSTCLNHPLINMPPGLREELIEILDPDDEFGCLQKFIDDIDTLMFDS